MQIWMVWLLGLITLCSFSSCRPEENSKTASTEAVAEKSLTPEEALLAFQIDSRCQIELVASEPHVIDPVSLTFSDDQRLWVIECSDYPNGPAAGELGESRIRVLSDLNEQGQYTQSSIFADGLVFATGLMLWKDGVLVTTDGKLLFLRDTDGDGRADQTECWFEGFATDNPQLRSNHPTLGPDNFIYIANGLRGGQIVPGESNPWGLSPQSEPLSMSGRDFRFHPLTGAYEAAAGMSQFGLTFDDWGNRFGCDNRQPCKQVILENEALKKAPWLRPSRIFENVSPAAEESRLYPISRSWTTSNLHANQFTAASGVLIYRGNALPHAFYGNSFVCEPTANLIHCDRLLPVGMTYRSEVHEEGKEFLASTDTWFRPVDLTQGPDGGLYVCDMYRAVIEHPDFMPEELKTRPDLLAGKDLGRIWRITAKEKNSDSLSKESSAKTLPMSQWSNEELVTALDHPNAWHRTTAQRLLLQRQDPQSLTSLRAYISGKTPVRSVGIALELLNSIGELTAEDLHHGFQQPSGQRTALQLAQRHFPGDSQVTLLAAQKLKEALSALQQKGSPLGGHDPGLVSQILLNTSWADWSQLNEMGEINLDQKNVERLVAEFYLEQNEDDWFSSVIAIHAADQLADVLSISLQLSAESEQLTSLKQQRIGFLAELLGRKNQKQELIATLEQVLVFDSAVAEELYFVVLKGLLSGLPQGASQLQIAILNELSESSLEKHQEWMSQLLERFQQENIESEFVPLLAIAPAEQTVPVLMRLALSAHTQSATAAIDVLLRQQPQVGPEVIDDLLSTPVQAIRRNLISRLGRSPEWSALLLDLVSDKKILLAEIDDSTRATLKRHSDETVRQRAEEILKDESAEDRKLVLKEYEVSLGMPADPLRGKDVFLRSCVTCHKVGEDGFNVGPDISDSREKTAGFLLSNILDPNQAIDNNYFSYTVVDVNGKIAVGVLDSETDSTVTLKQAGGNVMTIAREEIEMIRNNGVSLMPVGLEQVITVQEMADLISYLRNWRYLDGDVPQEVIQQRAIQ